MCVGGLFLVSEQRPNTALTCCADADANLAAEHTPMRATTFENKP